MGRIFLEQLIFPLLCKRCDVHICEKFKKKRYTDTEYGLGMVYTNVSNYIRDNQSQISCFYEDNMYDHDVLFVAEHTFKTYNVYCKNCLEHIGWYNENKFEKNYVIIENKLE